VAVELWQTQVAFAIGLLGVYIGWRGVISKMTGFYDLAGAVKYLLYGLVSGMLLAMAVDRIILPAIILSSLNIISVSIVALLIGAAEAAFVMFLVARPRVVALRGSPLMAGPWALESVLCRPVISSIGCLTSNYSQSTLESTQSA